MSSDVTQLLLDHSRGNGEALDRLLPLVYDELRSLANRSLRRERPGHTLQPTALAHECYLRLVDQRLVQWQNRAHFFAVAATAIRRILVDHARSRGAARRGGGRQRVEFDEGALVSEEIDLDFVALDEALEELAEMDPRKSRVVELRFFGGLGIEDVSEVLDISHATVEREWKLARAWLYREIRKGDQ